MRIFWLFGFVLPPVLLGSVALIAPQWLMSDPRAALVLFAAFLLWLRSLWWIGDWIYELTGGRPPDFPKALDLGFFQPKSSNLLQWIAVILQAAILTASVVLGCIYPDPHFGPTVSIMQSLAIGVPMAVFLTLKVGGVYELYYGLRDYSFEDLIEGIVTSFSPDL